MKISNVRIVGHHGHVEILADTETGETLACRMRESEFDTLAAFAKPTIPAEPPPDPKRVGSAAASMGLSPDQFDRLLAAMRAAVAPPAAAAEPVDLTGKSVSGKSKLGKSE